MAMNKGDPPPYTLTNESLKRGNTSLHPTYNYKTYGAAGAPPNTNGADYQSYASHPGSSYPGSYRPAGFSHVVVRQPLLRPVPSSPPPDDYLGCAIFVTLCCCCLPLGILAIIKANEVKTLYLIGDVHGSRRASRSARNLVWINMAIGAFVTLVTIILIGVAYASTYND